MLSSYQMLRRKCILVYIIAELAHRSYVLTQRKDSQKDQVNASAPP